MYRPDRLPKVAAPMQHGPSRLEGRDLKNFHCGYTMEMFVGGGGTAARGHRGDRRQLCRPRRRASSSCQWRLLLIEAASHACTDLQNERVSLDVKSAATHLRMR